MPKAEIIPGIIEDSWEPIAEKLARLEGKTDWVHLDVSDGVFTAHKTWNNPADLAGIGIDISIEAHLMISNPLNAVSAWLASVRRIIFHYEAVNKEVIEDLVQKIKNGNREVVIAVNPETPVAAVESYLSHVDGILVMGVKPGWKGSKFEPKTTEKIKVLRERWSDGIIEADGGVNNARVHELVSAGANRLVSTSFVWLFNDPAEGIRELRKLI